MDVVNKCCSICFIYDSTCPEYPSEEISELMYKKLYKNVKLTFTQNKF